MSHSHSQPLERGRRHTSGAAAGNAADVVRLSWQGEDRAIDAALRSVPLPEGLMTRLGRLAFTMPEEAPDQVDWLGC